jgi:hypothetical protein
MSGGTPSKPRRQVMCQILGRCPRDQGPPVVPGAYGSLCCLLLLTGGFRPTITVSMATRNGQFESNFLTLQGKPKHRSRGYSQSHKCNFCPVFPGCGSGPPPSSTEVHEQWNNAGPWLQLHPQCVHGNKLKRLRILSTHRSDQVLKLTCYHILGMWLVRSKT